MQSEISAKYEKICQNISLNIPEACSWQWDPRFNTPIVVFEKTDQDLIYFPITQEFDQRWDISSIDQSGEAFYDFFINRFGIIPGQIIFTSDSTEGWKLFAVWWPWGDDEKVSLRIGLYVDHMDATVSGKMHERLKKWFRL